MFGKALPHDRPFSEQPLEYTPCVCGFYIHYHLKGVGPNMIYPLSRCMAFRPVDEKGRLLWEF